MNSSYEQRYANALKKQHKKFIDSRTKSFIIENIEILNKCPVCNHSEYKIYCVKDGFQHKECLVCGLVYLDPKLSRAATLEFYNSEVNEIYNESKFHMQSDENFDDLLNLKNYKLIIENLNYNNFKDRKLLEIGPGRGAFLNKASKDGFNVYAVELNIKLVDNLRNITTNVYSEDLLSINLSNDCFDVIYFRDVMEHIDLPIPFLTEISRILKPGGLLVIDTHNIKSLVNFFTKEYHTVIFPFEHPVHWSPKSLKIAGEMSGLVYKKVYFDHNYQGLLDIIKYIVNPSFTYIYPPSKSWFRNIILFFTSVAIKFRLIIIDRIIMSIISSFLQRGAKMQIVFTKKQQNEN